MPSGDREPSSVLAELSARYPGLRAADLAHLADLRDGFMPFADNEFDIELVSDLQARFWEMYLARALLDAGHEIVPRSERAAAGPDLCVRDGNRHIWIEAIAPDSGTGPDAVPDFPADGESHPVPDPEITLRYTSAFTTKRAAFASYRAQGMVEPDDALIVAISGGRIPNVWTEALLPRIVHAMYALGPYAVTLDRETLEVVDEGHTFRDRLPKRSGVEIPTDSLLSEESALISAVFFSYADPCNRPDEAGRDMIVCHHSSPEVALERHWLRRGREYWVEDEYLRSADHNLATRDD